MVCKLTVAEILGISVDERCWEMNIELGMGLVGSYMYVFEALV